MLYKNDKKAKTRLSAFFLQKCPRCHTGDMFEGATYNPFTFYKVKSRCENCNLEYEVEPGFFTGAMYFSYAINVGIIVVTGVFFNIAFDWEIDTVIMVVLGFVFALVPVTFRYSRMLMMYLFSGVEFKKDIEK